VSAPSEAGEYLYAVRRAHVVHLGRRPLELVARDVRLLRQKTWILICHPGEQLGPDQAQLVDDDGADLVWCEQCKAFRDYTQRLTAGLLRLN